MKAKAKATLPERAEAWVWQDLTGRGKVAICGNTVTPDAAPHEIVTLRLRFASGEICRFSAEESEI